MLWVFIAIIAIVIIFVSVKSGMQAKQMAEEGKTIKRQSSFWESAEFFVTTATYDQVKSLIKNNSFPECDVDICYDVDRTKSVLFKSSHGWNGQLDCLGQQDGKNVFRFYFPAWKTQRYGIPQSVNTMNAMETAIEKTLLAIDPKTTVEMHKMDVKTKTKFF